MINALLGMDFPHLHVPMDAFFLFEALMSSFVGDEGYCSPVPLPARRKKTHHLH